MEMQILMRPQTLGHPLVLMLTDTFRRRLLRGEHKPQLRLPTKDQQEHQLSLGPQNSLQAHTILLMSHL
jgi:hypothetical protein